MRLIDADALVEGLKTHGACVTGMRQDEVRVSIQRVKEAPTVDAVEAVRCKDCQWWDGYGMCNQSMPLLRSGEEYCSRGERKDKQ